MRKQKQSAKAKRRLHVGEMPASNGWQDVYGKKIDNFKRITSRAGTYRYSAVNQASGLAGADGCAATFHGRKPSTRLTRWSLICVMRWRTRALRVRTF
jgi:hypothetical protein